MALLTYADLTAAVLNWPDLTGEDDLTSSIDTIISLAEARINRIVRLQRSLITLDVSGSGPYETYDLPSDLIQIDQILDDEGYALEPVLKDELQRVGDYRIHRHGRHYPDRYAIDGNSLVFEPALDAFTLRYFQKLPDLQTADTHWLYAFAPDLYLYASLIEAAVFSKEAQQELSRYMDRFQTAMGEVMAWDEKLITAKAQPMRASVGRRGRQPWRRS